MHLIVCGKKIQISNTCATLRDAVIAGHYVDGCTAVESDAGVVAPVWRDPLDVVVVWGIHSVTTAVYGPTPTLAQEAAEGAAALVGADACLSYWSDDPHVAQCGRRPDAPIAYVSVGGEPFPSRAVTVDGLAWAMQVLRMVRRDDVAVVGAAGERVKISDDVAVAVGTLGGEEIRLRVGAAATLGAISKMQDIVRILGITGASFTLDFESWHAL